MKISASLTNENQKNEVVVRTNETKTILDIKPQKAGRGSSINGGELLFLAIATCYCNDIYREATEMGIEVHSFRNHS